MRSVGHPYRKFAKHCAAVISDYNLLGAAPGELLHLNFITMFEGEGLLVLKDGFSGFIMPALEEAKWRTLRMQRLTGCHQLKFI
jgi:hypothetical protein